MICQITYVVTTNNSPPLDALHYLNCWPKNALTHFRVACRYVLQIFSEKMQGVKRGLLFMNVILTHLRQYIL